MPAASKPKPATKVRPRRVADPDERVRAALAWLERRGSRRNRAGMARYGIVAPKVFGVSVADLRAYGKRLGREHELALALWASGWHEARMLAAFVEDPAALGPAQMDRWCRDFDNWAICDTVCFHLFDRTPQAWTKIDRWAGRKEEFVRRAAFALLASLSVHDKKAADEPFLRRLGLIERAASDGRNFVKKAVNWALRSIGKRNARLHESAVALARRLADSTDPTSRWVGKDALRELTGPGVLWRLQTPRPGRAPRRSGGRRKLRGPSGYPESRAPRNDL